ncbi:carbohydrate ABC transporter permease [Blastopirellula marina]|uniref:Sugar ABC transporter permease n=1 Tax=Blastopirellula marina DSM 3645 TaxID=314230 RepID=A3ZMB3_9BACT|nr:sugar ABC transporter permease [Blastopirellula marina]EAQ82082.1 sugar ABC transporter permease [Blastopirellula marina DSM 3645]
MSSTRNRIAGYAFASPWLGGLVLLYLFPFAASLYWSFCRYDLINPPQWIGGENYTRLADEIATGTGFGQALANTAYYAAVGVPLSILLGITLAVLLSLPVRGQAIFRTLFFLPSVIPVVAASILWMWLLDPKEGIVNYGLASIGLGTPGWLQSSGDMFSTFWRTGTFAPGSKDALVLMSLWGVGNFMVIYLAALGDVPKSLYEAAQLDGAGAMRRFLHITLPMLTPIIFFNLVMGLIQSVQAFTQIYIVSEGRGSPAGSTMMISLQLFLSAFQHLDMGYASAVAWLLFVLLLVATLLLFRTSRRWVYYGG